MTATPRNTAEEFTFSVWDGPNVVAKTTFFGYGKDYAERVRDARRQAVIWHAHWMANLALVRNDGVALIPDTPCGPRDAHS